MNAAVSHRHDTQPLDFVGVGLVALGSVMTLASPFSAGNDWKTDATMLWEPELATFVSLGAVADVAALSQAVAQSLGTPLVGDGSLRGKLKLVP